MLLHTIGKFKKGIKNFDTKMQSLSPELLMELLESKDFDSSVHSKDDKEAISPKDLEQLLDRSHLLRQWKAKGNKKGMNLNSFFTRLIVLPNLEKRIVM